jgi:hypothetical protein
MEMELDDLKSLIRSKSWIETPRVEPLEPVIRSGDQFVIHVPTDDPQSGPLILDGLLPRGRYIGAFVIEWGYEISEPRSTTEFERWLIDFEAELELCAPDGVTYRGTYAVIASTTRREGRYTTLWGYQDLQALNRFANEMQVRGSRFGQLIRDLQAFMARDAADRFNARSQRIYQVAIGSRRTKK